MILEVLILIVLVIFFFTIFIISQRNYFKLQHTAVSHNDQLNRKLYENAVLAEIGDRIGYSLNVTKIAEIITGSLSNIVPFSTASYLIIESDHLLLRTNLRESVSENFIKEVKRRLLASLVALSTEDYSKFTIDEGTYGSLTSETNKNTIGSFFNIPLVINDKLTGIINVASTSVDLYKEADMTVLYKIAAKASDAVSSLQNVLETEKGKLQMMIESLVDGVVLLDNFMRLLVINPAAKSLLGINSTSVDVMDLVKVVEKSTPLMDRIKESAKSLKTIKVSQFLLNERFLELIISPVTGSSGLLGVSIIIRDRTQERTLERLRDDFTAMMVHELRTPLSVMYGTSDLLLKRLSQLPIDKTNELLFNIKDSSHYLLDIVNDILDAAKIEAGKFKVIPVPSDIKSLLLEERQYFEGVASGKGLTFITNIPDDLPPVLFDKPRVVQILNNLISNSIKFTVKGSITLGATLAPLERAVKVSVSDTGVGIEKEAQLRLFNKFEQLRNTVDPNSKGTGLGLVIAKGIVEAHGGRIWLESLEGRGTTFFFTLPLASDQSKTEIVNR